MKRNNTESITTLLHQYLRSEGLESPLEEYRLMAAWPNIVGEKINRQTVNMTIFNQVLRVELKSPVVRNEIMMQRQSLIKKLNDAAGGLVITDIFVK